MSVLNLRYISFPGKGSLMINKSILNSSPPLSPNRMWRLAELKCQLGSCQHKRKGGGQGAGEGSWLRQESKVNSGGQGCNVCKWLASYYCTYYYECKCVISTVRM